MIESHFWALRNLWRLSNWNMGACEVGECNDSYSKVCNDPE